MAHMHGVKKNLLFRILQFLHNSIRTLVNVDCLGDNQTLVPSSCNAVTSREGRDGSCNIYTSV